MILRAGKERTGQWTDMSKVLIIEDDEILNAGLCFHLQRKDIEVEPAYTLTEAEEYLKGHEPDLILLDVNLPDGNGFEFARKVLTKQSAAFVFLTAHNLDDDVIQGLQLGADDYITKPFGIRVLVEKIQTILRRCTKAEETSRVYTCKNLEVDFEKRTVSRDGQILTLTPTEFSLLELFCRNPNRILSKEILLEKIWDDRGNYVNDHALTLNISRLRGKLEDGENSYIKTVYGMGYEWMGGCR